MSSSLNEIVFENVRDIDLDHVFQCGQCFRWTPVNGGAGGYAGNVQEYQGVSGQWYCRARLDRDPAVENAGTLVLDVSGGSRDFWENYFDMKKNYGDIKNRLIREEPEIARATEAGGGIRILNQDFWEVLISFIVSQNNNIPRIMKCIRGLCEKFGDPVFADENGEEWYGFPSPESLASAMTEDLAEIKLGYRDEYIIRAARRFLELGEPSGTMEEKRTELLGYHGIGPKVADCIMLFGCREFRAFPIDTWVKTIMNDMYGFDRKDVKGMQAFAREKFGDLRGYAQQYLFYLYRDKK